MISASKVLERLTGPVTVAMLFRSYRFTNELSLEDMARELGVTKGFVSNVLTGKKKLSLKKTLEMARTLGEPIELYARIWFEEHAREAGLDWKKVLNVKSKRVS